MLGPIRDKRLQRPSLPTLIIPWAGQACPPEVCGGKTWAPDLCSRGPLVRDVQAGAPRTDLCGPDPRQPTSFLGFWQPAVSPLGGHQSIKKQRTRMARVESASPCHPGHTGLCPGRIPPSPPQASVLPASFSHTEWHCSREPSLTPQTPRGGEQRPRTETRLGQGKVPHLEGLGISFSGCRVSGV